MFRREFILYPILHISTQLLPLVALLARLTFGGLWSQNCLRDGMSCGENVLWDDILMG